MSWITELSKVYDNTIRNDIGEDGNGRPIPMFHTANNASVTILLDENGSFIKADSVDKKDRVTIMPCTESCAERPFQIAYGCVCRVPSRSGFWSACLP